MSVDRVLIPHHLAAVAMATVAATPFAGDEVAIGLLLILSLAAAVSGRRSLLDLWIPWPVILLLVWSTLAISWSVLPQTSAIAVAKTVGIVLLAIGIAVGRDIRAVMECLVEAALLVLVASWLAAWFIPSLGLTQELHEQGSLKGVFPHRNYLAFFSTVGFITAGCLAATRRRRSVLPLMVTVLSAASIFGASSRTSWIVIASVVMVGAFLGLSRSLRISVSASYLSALLLLAAVTWGLAGQREQLLGRLDRDVTLTGRTDIWAAVWTAIQDRPLGGYGLNALYVPGTPVTETMWSDAGFAFYHAHNGFLETTVEIGVVGLITLLLLTASAARNALSHYSRTGGPGGLWPVLLVTTLMIYSLTETVAFSGLGLLLLTTLASVGPARSPVSCPQGQQRPLLDDRNLS